MPAVECKAIDKLNKTKPGLHLCTCDLFDHQWVAKTLFALIFLKQNSFLTFFLFLKFETNAKIPQDQKTYNCAKLMFESIRYVFYKG